MARREKGRNASYYAHPLGKRVGDILLHHEQGRPDKTANLMNFSMYHCSGGSFGSIISMYGGYDEYIQAMSRIYNSHVKVDVYHNETLAGVAITPTGRHGYSKMRENYAKVLKDGSLFSDWVPVFWYHNFYGQYSMSDSLLHIFRELDTDWVDSGNMCMYQDGTPSHTVVYMRKSFLERTIWGQTKITFFDSLSLDYKINHKL